MKNKIELIIEELQYYNHKDKSQLLINYIKERLDKSLLEYYDQLNTAFTNLTEYNEKRNLTLMKKLNKD